MPHSGEYGKDYPSKPGHMNPKDKGKKMPPKKMSKMPPKPSLRGRMMDKMGY